MAKLLRVILALIFAVGFGAAQAQTTVDYNRWDTLAEYVQRVLETDAPRADTLEALRARVTEQRTVLESAAKVNDSEIALLETQLDTLGAPPEDGSAEDPEIVARRETLTQELAEARAPVLRAQEALSKANGLIEQIDASLRTQQTRWVLTQDESPLAPTQWQRALTQMGETLSGIGVYTTLPPGSITPRPLVQRLPVALLLLALAAVLLTRGWRIARYMGELARRLTRSNTGVWSLLVSLLQIILPLSGLFALVASIALLGVLPPLAEQIVTQLPLLGLPLLAYRWLVGRLFPADHPTLLPFERTRHPILQRDVTWLGLLIGLDLALLMLSEDGGWSDSVLATWRFPVLVLMALVLWRMATHMRLRAENDQEDFPLIRRLLSWLAYGVTAVAILAPLAAAAGYANLAYTALSNTHETLALLLLIRVLQRFAQDLWVLLTGGRGSREALVPTLVGFAIAVLALPLLALIWGARLTELTELWQRFLNGFTIGETRISPSAFLVLAGVFGFGLVVTRVLQASLRNSVLPKTRLDKGGQNAVLSGLGYVGIFLAGLFAINAAGLDLSSLAIVAGALSVGIGFGLQNVVSNFVSGIILLIERPISEGDWIQVAGVEGIVSTISVRSTRIQTFNRADVIVPNADLVSGVVTNLTRQNYKGRLVLPVGVAYGTDTRYVEQLLLQVCEDCPNLDPFSKPLVTFQGFGASSLDMDLRVIMADVNKGLSTRTELNHRIRELFEQKGIEIAFPQQDIWIRTAQGASQEPQS